MNYVITGAHEPLYVAKERWTPHTCTRVSTCSDLDVWRHLHTSRYFTLYGKRSLRNAVVGICVWSIYGVPFVSKWRFSQAYVKTRVFRTLVLVFTKYLRTFTKSPPTLSKSPPTFTKSPPIFSKSPPIFTKSPPIFSKSPPTFSKSPPIISKSPPTFAKSPPTFVNPYRHLINPHRHLLNHHRRRHILKKKYI